MTTSTVLLNLAVKTMKVPPVTIKIHDRKRSDTTATPSIRSRKWKGKLPLQNFPKLYIALLFLFSCSQLLFLNFPFTFNPSSFFKECPHPDDKQRKELSRELGLEPLQVKFWFQNKRTQMKVKTCLCNLDLGFIGINSGIML